MLYKIFKKRPPVRRLGEPIDLCIIDSLEGVLAHGGLTMPVEFQRGDRVIIRALGNRIGIIDGDPRLVNGRWLYPVSINPNQSSFYYPEEALEKFIPPRFVEERLKLKEFSPVKDFVQQLICKFRRKSAVDSELNRPPIPIQTGH